MKNKIHLIVGDITKLSVDAIVNAPNNSLMGGGGVDGAIHRVAGTQLSEACRWLKGCATGQSKLTGGFNLPVKYIIHTVGPVWNNGTNKEELLLASCYQTSLQIAVEHNLKTIAFPSISTGAYRFPFDKAAQIAYQTTLGFLNQQNSIELVYLVCFSEKDLEQYSRAIKSLV